MNRIRQQREASGWTVRQLAKKVGVNYTSISFWENGRKEPRSGNKLKLARVLKCPPDYLFPALRQDQKTVNILLIEDNPDDVERIQRLMKLSPQKNWQLTWVDRLAKGLETLKSRPVHLILLDLRLSESQGIATFQKVYGRVPEIPIIVLTGFDDKELALKTLRGGAQDYLMKGEIEQRMFFRAVRYAIERQKLVIQHQKAEQRLQESLRTFKIAGDLISDGLMVLQESTIVQVNSAFLRIFGYARESEANNHSLEEIFEAEDGQTVRKHILMDHLGFRKFRGVRKGGRGVWVCVCGRGTLYNGKPARIIAIRELDDSRHRAS